MKIMGNNDTLSLKVDEDDMSYLNIIIENSEKNTVTRFKLNLMDLHEENIEVPPPSFESVITMPALDFQKICRDMHTLADEIELKSVGEQLIFGCKGQFAEQETSIGSSSNGLSFIQNTKDKIVQGVYALKHLVLFSKCSNLCNSVELY